jgi:CHRD domain
MKRRRLSAALLLAALAALALAGPASAAKLGGADHGGRLFTTTLSGAEEVDPETGALGAGDPDGSGLATLTVNPGQQEVCYELSVEGISPLPASGAHIHVGDAGENGPVVVPLAEPDASGVSSGCAPVSRELALAIIQNPENYYVNVHTTDFPNGAIRGQLSK